MKKIIFAICLALLSSNVNARCFDAEFDLEFNQCTVFEAIDRFQNNNIRFIHYYAGFAQGLAYGETLKNIEFYHENDDLFQKCIRTSSAQIHKDILMQFLSGEVDRSDDYSILMAKVYTEQWKDCINKEIEIKPQQ